MENTEFNPDEIALLEVGLWLKCACGRKIEMRGVGGPSSHYEKRNEITLQFLPCKCQRKRILKLEAQVAKLQAQIAGAK